MPEVDLAQNPAFSLALNLEEVKFPHALVFESLDPLFRVSKQGPSLAAIQEDGGDKRLVQLEPACEADGVAPPDPV